MFTTWQMVLFKVCTLSLIQTRVTVASGSFHLLGILRLKYNSKRFKLMRTNFPNSYSGPFIFAWGVKSSKSLGVIESFSKITGWNCPHIFRALVIVGSVGSFEPINFWKKNYSNLLLLPEERNRGSKLLTCLDFLELWTHQLKFIERALI